MSASIFKISLAVFISVILAGVVLIGGYSMYSKKERVAVQQAEEQRHIALREQAVALEVGTALARQSVAYGLATTGMLRTQIAEYYASEGKLPTNNQEVGFEPEEVYRDANLRGVSLQADGRLVLVFNRNSGVDGGVVVLKPKTLNYAISFECMTPDYAFIAQVKPDCLYQPEEKSKYTNIAQKFQ